MIGTKHNVEVYKTLDDFVGDLSRSGSQNVRLENIQNLFLYFGSFLVLTLLVFLKNIFLLKQLPTINRQLVRCVHGTNFGASLFKRIFKVFSIVKFAKIGFARLTKGFRRVLGILKLKKANLNSV